MSTPTPQASEPVQINGEKLTTIEQQVTVNQQTINQITNTTIINGELNNASLNANTTFSGDSFKNSSGDVIALPSESGTLALVADIEDMLGDLGQDAGESLADKFQSWLEDKLRPASNGVQAGIIMSDITAAVAALEASVATGYTFANSTLTNPEMSTIKNGSATITVPSTTGTMALTSDITTAINNLDSTLTSTNAETQEQLNYLAARLEATLQYLSQWIAAGNISMSNIKTVVDGAVAALSPEEDDGEGEQQQEP